MTAKKLNCRQARWSLLLARFNFAMNHQPGKTMGKSDALSCRSVRVSSVALWLGSKMDPCQRDLTNILLSYLVSDSFGPILGASAWLCKTISIHLSLPQLWITLETLGKKCLKLPPRLSMFYITFLLYGVMGLTVLDHIYSLFL